MNSPCHRWLVEQLPEWEREGLVTPEAAQTLRGRYRVEPRPEFAQMIVGAMGALLIGVGLIAVLAYNWDEFPRPVRLLLALGPLAATQAMSGLVLRKGQAARPWLRETAPLLQTLAVGAAMAIVSQIYNIQGEWTDLAFWWCVVAVPLAWVFQSHAVAIVYLLGITAWAIGESTGSFSFRAEAADLRVWYPLLLAGILPLWPGANLKRWPPTASRWVLAASSLVGFIAVASQASRWPSRGLPWMAMLTSAVIMLLPLNREGTAAPLARKPQVILGGIALVFMSLCATYEDPARELMKAVESAILLSWCWVLGGVLVTFGAVAVFQRRFAVLAVAGLAVVPLPSYALAPSGAGGWPMAVTYSLVLLTTAIALIALEFMGRQGAARIGATLITILVIMRMADADMSLLVKGVAFIVIGFGFLAFNAFISRRRAATLGVETP